MMGKLKGILSTQELSIGYSGKSPLTVASGINLDLNLGTMVGVVGRNGMGKSTLLRTIAGLQPALSGVVTFNDKALGDLSALELATQLGLVLTDVGYSKNLSVLEFVSLGRQPHTNWMGQFSPADHQAVDLAIAQTEIEALVGKKCHELSDGQMQRVAIARALAQETSIIVLDEPTAHLDLYHKAAILKLLKQLSEEHQKLIVYATHDIELALQMADLLVLMTKDGVRIDQPEQLIKSGNFESIFPKEVVTFDPESGRFTIQN